MQVGQTLAMSDEIIVLAAASAKMVERERESFLLTTYWSEST